MGQVETNPDLALEDDRKVDAPIEYRPLIYLLVGFASASMGGLGGVAIIHLLGGWPAFWPLAVLSAILAAIVGVLSLPKRSTLGSAKGFWTVEVSNLALITVLTLSFYGFNVITNDVKHQTLAFCIEQGAALLVSTVMFGTFRRSTADEPAAVVEANKPTSLVFDSFVFGLFASVPTALFGFAPHLAANRLATGLVIAGSLFFLGMMIARIRRAVEANQSKYVAFWAAAAFMAPPLAGLVVALLKQAGR